MSASMTSVAFAAQNGVNSALAGAAALVACAFALSTADRWLRRGQPHERAWTIAMTLFALGSFSLWWAESAGWSSGVFRLFFLTGAVLNVAWLSLGEIVADQFPTGKEVFGAAPRILAAVGSGVPALVIILGAVWSTWRVLAKRNPSLTTAHARQVTSPGRLAVGNVLIATGTIVLSASGSLAGRLGKDQAFAVTLLSGVIVLFAGFLVASNSTRRASVQRAAQYLAGATSR
ncbi:MAG: hypothetical protein EBT09_04050 [Actinobacteria bacterium]|nr:hypothetical protein [Actinomycetota bacterium]